MVLLEPGYNGTVPDEGYIRIAGVNYRISELEIGEDREHAKISIYRFGKPLYLHYSYALFTTDSVSEMPLTSYEALLAALNSLNAFYYGGVNATKVRATAGTNAGLIKVGVTKLYSILALNPAAVAAYLKLFDMNTTPVAGTDIPLMTFDTRLLPAGPVSFGIAVDLHHGLAMTITAGADDGDHTAVAAGDVMVTLVWE